MYVTCGFESYAREHESPLIGCSGGQSICHLSIPQATPSRGALLGSLSGLAGANGAPYSSLALAAANLSAPEFLPTLSGRAPSQTPSLIDTTQLDRLRRPILLTDISDTQSSTNLRSCFIGRRFKPFICSTRACFAVTDRPHLLLAAAHYGVHCLTGYHQAGVGCNQFFRLLALPEPHNLPYVEISSRFFLVLPTME